MDKKLENLITVALEKEIIELGYTLDGPVGFVVNGLTLSDGFDTSNKEDALCIDEIWYASDNYEFNDDFDDDDDDEYDDRTDDELFVEEIRSKYDNKKLAEMIVESLFSMNESASNEIITYLENLITLD